MFTSVFLLTFIGTVQTSKAKENSLGRVKIFQNLRVYLEEEER